MAALDEDSPCQFVTTPLWWLPSLVWIWGWSACSSPYFTPTVYRKGCLPTTFPLYPDSWTTKGIHLNNGNFLPGAFTQLSSCKKGKFGGKSEGTVPQRDTAKAQPTGNTNSCFPRNIQLFSTANKFPARVIHHSQALFNVPLEHIPLSPHTQKENSFAQERCFRTLLPEVCLIKQRAKNSEFSWIYESYLDGVYFESWHSKISLEHYSLL